MQSCKNKKETSNKNLSNSKTTTLSQKPNIVFILADDLGFMDLSSYAAKTLNVHRDSTFYETPNIDRLADEGVAFTQAYGNQLCSPTRAAVLTGRYSFRIGISNAHIPVTTNAYNQQEEALPGHLQLDSNHSDPIDEERAYDNAKVLTGLPSGLEVDKGRDEICLPEVLESYNSAFIGKWHLGNSGTIGYQPDDQNFESLMYFDSGGCPYFDWEKYFKPGTWKENDVFKAIWDKPRKYGFTDTDYEHEYLTDALTQRAVDYIEERAENPKKPFFLYLSEFSIHGPWQAKAEDIAYFENKKTRGWNGHDNATYAGMVKSLDESVGRIRDVLEKTGLIDNTIIVFMSDNGGVASTTANGPIYTSNAPLRAGKAHLYEGGIRVPLIIWDPSQKKKGQWCDVPVHSIDIFPTISEFTNSSYSHEIDGQTLSPLLADVSNKNKTYQKKSIFWHYPFNVIWTDDVYNLPLTPKSAMRNGDYKLIFDWHGKLELYNLKDDIGEKNDLSLEKPELTKSLFKELIDWLDNNVEARYFPVPNPEYNASIDKRPYPYKDLRKEMLGIDKKAGLPDNYGWNSLKPGFSKN